MSTEAMRASLKENTKYRYSEKWHTKVDKMPEYQVFAVYKRFERDGMFIY